MLLAVYGLTRNARELIFGMDTNVTTINTYAKNQMPVFCKRVRDMNNSFTIWVKIADRFFSGNMAKNKCKS